MLRLLLVLTSAGNCAASVPPSKEECADLVGILQDGSGKLPPTWGDAIDRLRQTCAKFQSDGFCDDVLHAVVRGYEDKEAAALFEADAMLCGRVSAVKQEALAYSRSEGATRQTNQAWVEETLKQRLIKAMIQRSSAEYDTSQKEGFLARGQGHRMQAAVSVDSSFRKKRSPTEAPTEAPTTLPTESPTVTNIDWSIRPLPYVDAVKKACAQDCKLHCAEYNEDSLFHARIGCLERHREELQPACRETAFGGTTGKPNPLIFHKVWTGDLAKDSKKKDLSKPLIAHIGYVMAPLFFNTPTRSPIIKVWFGMTEARKQPAPKGLLFFHAGGPAPSLGPGLFTYRAFSKDLQDTLLDEYDIVSVDQRGLGMSGFELLYDIDTNLLLQNATPLQLRTHFGKQPLEAGSLTESLIFPELQAEFPTPCTFLRKSHFVEPKDWGDLKEVSTYLDRKAQFAARCNRAFEKDDGEGGKYSPLQFVGTSALVRDTEWMRWSFGAPTITVLGLSYGTRVAAAYSAAFPHAVARAAVVGVMGPEPDLLQYAKQAALNTGEILGFIQSQCVKTGPDCMKNPFSRDDTDLHEQGFFFDGDLNAAVDEVFLRSKSGGAFYKALCGPSTSLSTHRLTQILQAYLTAGPIKPLDGFQNFTWPLGFAALPSVIFYIAQNPCKVAEKKGGERSFWESDLTLDVFNLIGALDMTGRWSRNQAAGFITSFANDDTFSPGLNMFLAYAGNAHGVPLLPMPIAFSNPQVRTLIGQGLYDERTAMAFAQLYKIHFSNSTLVTSLSGGHLVNNEVGVDAWRLVQLFVLAGTEPQDGTITGEPLSILWNRSPDLMRMIFK